MSRLGKKPILIPEGVEAKKDDGRVIIKGPLGELSRDFKPDIEIQVGEKEITLRAKKNDKNSKMLWGTYAAHLKNMIHGATKGFEKKLAIEGIGYKAQVDGSHLTLSVGFSHPVKMAVPEGLKVSAQGNVIVVSGIDAEKVGNFSAKIRAIKKPEPYKGKGIRYEGEYVRRKAGKKQA